MRFKKKELDLVFSIKNPGKKSIKNSIIDIEQKAKDEEQNPKTKFTIEFDLSLASSIKCLAVKKMK